MFLWGFCLLHISDRSDFLITKIEGHDKYFEQKIPVVLDSKRPKTAFANSKGCTATVLALIKKTVLKQIEDIYIQNHLEIWNNGYTMKLG